LERNPTVGVFGASTTGNNNGSDSGAEDDGDYRPTHTSFGARLRAGKDEDEDSKSEEEQPKVLLEQDGWLLFFLVMCVLIFLVVAVVTGEEEEETLHQVRGKLFSLVGGNTWKERGTGLLKLNVKRDDGTGARLGIYFSPPPVPTC
jgi:Ran-binding protein 3